MTLFIPEEPVPSLCTYLNEDPEKLVRAYLQTVMGVYVILKEVALPDDDPQDTGVLIEGVEVLSDLSSIVQACALLFGLINCLNLSYSAELKCTFEVVQKIFLNLNGQRLSSKAQLLKNKLLE
uniref:Uncharacterized protein n=1 Tax=Cyprinus carpio carpio TaxID=630221 RepID=A0A9J8D8E0_CYPCA